MSAPGLRIDLIFQPDDQLWLRRTAVELPDFWAGHPVPPQRGDVLRIGGRQFGVQARVWEHDADGPRLALYLGSGHAHSDTVFG